jgi:hypothetical protein
VQFIGDAAPEFVGLLDGFAIQSIVLLRGLDVSVLAEVLGALEHALFLQDGIDAGGGIRGHGGLRYEVSGRF